MKQVTPNKEIFWVSQSIKLQQEFNEKCGYTGYEYLSDIGDHDYIYQIVRVSCVKTKPSLIIIIIIAF